MRLKNKTEPKEERKVGRSRKEESAFSECPICGRRLANGEAVDRHVNNSH